jgi:superoxide dismutase, Fe-Mn family
VRGEIMTSIDDEVSGSFTIPEKDIVTRRELMIMGAIAAGGLTSALPALGSPSVAGLETAPMANVYLSKDFSSLAAKKMEGLSAGQIDQHIKLYKGYISKANELSAKLMQADINGANATYAPLRELLVEESYAVNGVIYHEYYFGNLGGAGGDPSGEVRAALEERFGSTGKFMDYLKAAGKCMRGWVVVGYNTRAGHLSTFGLDTHNMWSPANVIPILVLDVYEHAYMIDYGIDRAKYLDAFVKNINWDVVSKRLALTRKPPSGLDSTA